LRAPDQTDGALRAPALCWPRLAKAKGSALVARVIRVVKLA